MLPVIFEIPDLPELNGELGMLELKATELKNAEALSKGPDGETEYLIYHAWDKDMTARQMCVDRLIWTPEGPRCEGPTLPWSEAQSAATV